MQDDSLKIYLKSIFRIIFQLKKLENIRGRIHNKKLYNLCLVQFKPLKE